MALNNIEKLIAKYENAETSLEEEAQLKAYFQNEEVAPHLEHYKPMFQYFVTTQKEQFTKDVPLKTKRLISYQWISVAAVVVLLIGIFVPQWFGPTEEEKQEALMVYNQTMEALSLVSAGLNQGREQMATLNLVTENINEGVEKASRLGEFNKTTNRILKNN
ncbi:MAG: hypothetical protein HKP45_01540 [Winogradskyella sp.]|nr:hypothetical protein [Winogradskyella sp.]MBT8376468.1 hypothetical protein [Bacteroidia bacterium]NNK39316.1 hypothetical protein [Winogradskyella sp.]NNL82873.1 hypothetical protein [Winogradskyella sp.]